MDGLREEPINVSVDLDEERLVNHDGNLRRMKGLEWHHFATIFVLQKPNTSTTVTGSADRNRHACGGRRVCLNLHPLARDLIRNTRSNLPPHYSPNPVIYSLHGDNGFQILQGGLCVCQTWK